ncbi:MAG: HAD-IA family hydrolase [Pseudomonadota bacterium]
MGAVVFDLDGTLADTSGDLLAAANACFRAMGHGDVLGPHDAGVALRGGRRMLSHGLARLGVPEEGLVDQYYPVLLDAYGADISSRTTLFPGVMSAIAALKRAGYAVGICTNKPEGLADQLLTDLGIRADFGALVGADTLPVRKPDPAPLFETASRLGRDRTHCLLVGDSDTDRNTAKAAGVPSILVTFGPSGEDMAALAPEALLADYADLPGIVADLMAP